MKLKLTSQGKRVVGSTTTRRLRGVMEIRDTAGTAISSTRITIKLKKTTVTDGPRRIDRDAVRVLDHAQLQDGSVPAGLHAANRTVWAPCLTAHLLAFMFRS